MAAKRDTRDVNDESDEKPEKDGAKVTEAEREKEAVRVSGPGEAEFVRVA